MAEVLPLHATPLPLGMTGLTVIHLKEDTSHSTALLHAIINKNAEYFLDRDWGIFIIIFSLI